MRAFAFVAIGLLAAQGAAAMPPPPSLPGGIPTVNDGYLVVSQAPSNGPQTMVCPPNKWWLGAYSRSSSQTCSDDDGGMAKKGTNVPSVTPQAAVDMAFGKGVATVVGVSPLFSPSRVSTVIYYRLFRKGD